ncbi:TonB-dependent receptor domain-containing protein [Deminuibacter soli]|uniref:TonB-dependent receptor n=1 Tax=Deminuibacter soli TaxID=2291815 RepID=A0A3E1NGR7_9BACT|nr:TonB-dependent receptor [Deminuibacter soli]RFM27077.1 TonB-dependent receptor [Deminuibacter soli]
MKTILTLLLITLGLAAHSQQLASRLTDSSTGKPVSFATIGLYKANDTSKAIVQSISKEDGSFTIKVKDTAQHVLVITHASYATYLYPIKGALPASIALAPATQSAGSVVVTGIRKQLVEKVDDKLVYNVESDVGIDGLMATDVLAKTPFVTVDADGNVQLKGQSNFKILLNGKESGLFAKDPKEALKSFPANAIKRIEVTTNPSAKYDAEGVGGVINIITKKKVAGYNGSLSVYQNTIGTHNGNGSMNVKWGKFGFTSYLGIGEGRNRPAQTHQETESLQPVAYAKRIIDGTSTQSWGWLYGTSELSYDIDSLNTMSAYLNGGYDHDYNGLQSDVRIISPDFKDTAHSKLNTNNAEKYPWNDIGMDYIHKFSGNAEKEWSVKLNRQFARDNVTGNSDQLADANRYILNDNQSHNAQYTFQTDFVLPLPKKTKLELGAKVILRNAAADYISLYRNSPQDKFTYDSSNTNRFHYSQDVWAAYFTYLFNIKKWQVKLGSRLEHTEVKGDFESQSVSLRQNYFNYIPSVYVSRKIGTQQDISFSYSKRLRRPYIWDLNPFTDNTDTLNITYGNPNLKPEVTHSLEVGYSVFKGSNSINIRLSENICNSQVIKYTTFNDETGVSSTTPDNVGENRFTALNLNVNVKLYKIWNLSGNTGIQYNSIRNRNNSAQHNSGISGNGWINNTVDITKNFSWLLNGGFWQPPIQLQGKNALNYGYNTGITLKTFKKQLLFTVRAGGFLQQYFVQKSTFKDENFVQTKEVRNRYSNIGFNIRWNFGKLTESTSRKRGVNNDDIKK